MDERRGQVATRLSESGRQALEYLSALAADQWSFPVTEEWTVRDMVAHMVSTEPALLNNIRRILSGEMVAHPEFDVARWNQRQVEKRRDQDSAQLLEAMALERQATLTFLQGLGPSDLENSGWHPSHGELTVEGHFQHIARHEEEHVAQIRQAIGAP